MERYGRDVCGALLKSRCVRIRCKSTLKVRWHIDHFKGESPSLEIFKTRLDKVLCSLLWVTLLRQGGWTG